MKILKYLLNYISFFMIFLIVFALVYFRTEIFPDNFIKPIDANLAVIEDKFDIEIPSYQAINSADKQEKEFVEPVLNTEIEKTIVPSTVSNIENIHPELTEENLASSVDASAQVETKETVIPQNILYQARQAYWAGDIKAAEQIYKKLTANSRADANVYGELGNIYYLQGKWKPAANAYYEAAIRLIDNKQYAQVNYLLRVIQGLNPNVAKKLQKKIFG